MSITETEENFSGKSAGHLLWLQTTENRDTHRLSGVPISFFWLIDRYLHIVCVL